MQVQRVQNNSQPQFGALISRGVSKEALARKGQYVIEALKEVKNYVADTRFVNMEIVGDEVTPKVHNYMKYFDPQEVNAEFLKIKSIWGGANMGRDLIPGHSCTLTIQFPTAKDAQKAYHEMQNTTSQYKRAGILTKILDNRAIKQFNESQNKKADYDRTLDIADQFLKSLS